MNKHKHPKLINAILLCVIIYFAACQGQADETAHDTTSTVVSDSTTRQNQLELTPEQLKTIQLDTTHVQQASIQKNLLLTGKVSVSPTHLTSLSSVLGGNIKSLHVIPGQQVNKGQVLATIADLQIIQLQQDFLTTKADLLSTKANFDRQQILNTQKAASDKTFETVRADFQKLSATVRALEQKLRLLHIDPTTLQAHNIRQTINIYAPFSGTVSKVLVNSGQYVTPTDVICELIDPKGFVLQLNTFEKDLPKLKNGQKINAYTNGTPDQKKSATIINKVGSLDEDGAGSIYAKLDQPEPSWVSGTYVNANVTISDYEVSSLPQACIISFENKQYVFVQTGTATFELSPVVVGESSNGQMEIRNPETLANRSIVQKGAYDLLMAMKNKAEE